MEQSGRVNVFVSYRRQDTNHLAGRLYDRLVGRFGRNHVFMDVDSIAPGSDFHEAINNAVAASDVLLALIGEKWAILRDAHGRLRLDEPDDLVRTEIEAALRHRVRVIPVLADEARMPHEDAVPVPLRPLLRRQAVGLTHKSFNSDVEVLLTATARTAARGSDRSTPPSGQRPVRQDPPPRTQPSAEPARGRSPSSTRTATPASAWPPITARDATRSIPAVGRLLRPAHGREARRRVVAVAGALILLLGLVLVGWYVSAAGPTVPDLSGKTAADAREAVTRAGLTAAPETTAVVDPTLHDHVISQHPAPNEQVAAGSTVSYAVGAAPPIVPQASAAPTGVPKPAPGAGATRRPTKRSPAPTTTVSAAAPTCVEVPDVRNMPSPDASHALDRAGFRNVGSEKVPVTDPGQVGAVVAQSPPPETCVDPAARVVVEIGEASPPGTGG